MDQSRKACSMCMLRYHLVELRYVCRSLLGFLIASYILSLFAYDGRWVYKSMFKMYFFGAVHGYIGSQFCQMQSDFRMLLIASFPC